MVSFNFRWLLTSKLFRPTLRKEKFKKHWQLWCNNLELSDMSSWTTMEFLWSTSLIICQQFNIAPSWAILLWKLRAPWNNLTKLIANSDILEWEPSKTQNWLSLITSLLEAIMSIYWFASSRASSEPRRMKKAKVKKLDNDQLHPSKNYYT